MAVAIGSVQTVMVCVPGSSGFQGPCPFGQVLSATQAYLIAPSESTCLDLMAQPFDSVVAGQFFGFAFVSTVFVYLVSLSMGSIISFVQRA